MRARREGGKEVSKGGEGGEARGEGGKEVSKGEGGEVRVGRR